MAKVAIRNRRGRITGYKDSDTGEYTKKETKYTVDPNKKQMGRGVNKAKQDAKNKQKNQQKNLNEITRRPPKKGAPEPLPKNLRYPFSAIDNTMDFIKFTVCRYKRNQNKMEGDNSSSYVTRDDKDLMGTILGDIILPIPAQLSDTNTANYGSSNMNFMQEAGMDVGKALLDQGGTSKAGQAVNRMVEGLTSKQGSKAISNFFGAQAVNAFGGNLNPAQVIARGTGAVINPNMELLFSGPSLRNFSYSFKLTPRFEQEANTVRTIIKAFKRNMAPKGAGGDFLKTPNIFQIEYLYQGKPHPYLNRIKLCALTNVATNYTGDGTYATYGDGSPISMQLNLTFSELTPIFNEDYEAYSDTSDGVGY
tara:strand:+ start:919 stop:2010 length:1092 start_codon:yes stop_codon:yes gene_type:complete